MNDDTPNYSQRIVQRRMLTTAATGFAFVLTTTGVWVGVADWLDDRTDIEPHTLAAMTQGSAFVCGVVAAVLTAFAVRRIHRSLWPETPDEG
jgi:hypothetical protein